MLRSRPRGRRGLPQPRTADENRAVLTRGRNAPSQPPPPRSSSAAAQYGGRAPSLFLWGAAAAGRAPPRSRESNASPSRASQPPCAPPRERAVPRRQPAAPVGLAAPTARPVGCLTAGSHQQAWGAELPVLLSSISAGG